MLSYCPNFMVTDNTPLKHIWMHWLPYYKVYCSFVLINENDLNFQWCINRNSSAPLPSGIPRFAERVKRSIGYSLIIKNYCPIRQRWIKRFIAPRTCPTELSTDVIKTYVRTWYFVIVSVSAFTTEWVNLIVVFSIYDWSAYVLNY